MSNLIRVELDEASQQKINNLELTVENIEKIVMRASSQSYSHDRLLRIDEVETMISFTRKWIYAKMRENLFPKPVKLSNASRWKLLDIQEWIKSQEYM